MDPSKVFLSNLIAGHHEQHEPDRNDNDDASVFLVTSADEVSARDIFWNDEPRSEDVSDTIAANQLAENAINYQNLPTLLDRLDDAGGNENSNVNNPTTPPPTPTIPRNDED